MSYSLNSYQRKNRQRARLKLMIKLGFVLTALIVGGFFYHFGESQMQARVNQRLDEMRSIANERDTLHKQVIDLQANELVNQQKIAELQNRYMKQIPDESYERLISLLHQKIDGGVSLERMQLLLSAAANPRGCGKGESKRFMLSTPLNQGTNSSATFGNGAVTVSGDGQTATSTEAKPEAWFDPDKPVSMKFHLIGGHVSVAEGVLPLQHAIIDDAIEHRFTIEAGPKGFVIVTADHCDYPAASSAPALDKTE